MIVLDSNILIEIFDKHSSVGGRFYDRIIDSREPFSTTALNPQRCEELGIELRRVSPWKTSQFCRFCKMFKPADDHHCL